MRVCVCVSFIIFIFSGVGGGLTIQMRPFVMFYNYGSRVLETAILAGAKCTDAR